MTLSDLRALLEEAARTNGRATRDVGAGVVSVTFDAIADKWEEKYGTRSARRTVVYDGSTFEVGALG